MDNLVIETRRHAKLGKKLCEYAEIFSTSDRAIKYWIKRGKLCDDPIPLDDPPRMADWWRRCMERDVPDKLLAFEALGSRPSAVKATQPDQPPPEPRDFSDVKGLDIEENVEALRLTVAINKKLLDEALASANEEKTALRARNYERCFELLRKAEQTLIDLQKERGNLIDKEGVCTELAQLFEALRLMRETMPRKIVIEIEKALPRRRVRIIRLLENFLNTAVEKVRSNEEEIFRQLKSLDSRGAVVAALDATDLVLE
jgi:hypothetical protein